MEINYPLLSICIPTYNRSELLRQCLESIATEANQFNSAVEIIVSNNCSTDNTSKVVQDYTSIIDFKYHEHSRNIGATLNMDYMITKLASGRFCWIIGDDDIIRKGAIEKILFVIENNDFDFIFMNHSYEMSRDFCELTEVTCQKLESIKKPLCSLCEDRVVERWEDIINFSNIPALYTSIVSSIFRRDTWDRSILADREIEISNPYTSMIYTFPHTYILSRHNIGKPCYFIGFPYVAFFIGAQEWIEQWNFMLVKYVLELSDLFEMLNARKSMVEKYRNVVFKHSSDLYLNALLKNHDILTIFQHLVKYFRYIEYWKMLVFNLIFSVFPKSNFKKVLKTANILLRRV